MSNGSSFIEVQGFIKQPEFKEFNGKTKAVIGLATKDSRKNKQGEWVDETTWYDVEIYGDYNLQKVSKMNKGDLVFARGNFRQRPNPKGGSWNTIECTYFRVDRAKQQEQPALASNEYDQTQDDSYGNPF